MAGSRNSEKPESRGKRKGKIGVSRVKMSFLAVLDEMSGSYITLSICFLMGYFVSGLPFSILKNGIFVPSVYLILKLVSAIFIKFSFFFSPNDGPSKTMKNAFYFI